MGVKDYKWEDITVTISGVAVKGITSVYYGDKNYNGGFYKYRVPKIEEFVYGFTYEVYSEGYFEDGVEDFCGWYTYTVGVDCWRDIEEIESELNIGNIRVPIR